MNINPLSSSLVFVDLETTGATASTDRITEIGIVEVSENGITEWSSLVRPDALIPPFIERMTGISNNMVAHAPRFAELAEEVYSRLQGHLFIAHNAGFDYGFLKNEFRRVGINFRSKVLCTVKLSRKLYPQHFKHNLDTLIERHGLQANGRHRALADAQLIHQFWQKALQEFPAEHIHDTVQTLTAGPVFPAQIDANLIDDLPERHGVYIFYGEHNKVLFVSKSQHVKKSVLAHFSADKKNAKAKLLAAAIRRIEWEECSGELGAQLKESQLIKRLCPIAKQQHAAIELCSWQLIETNAGHWQPQIRYVDDPEIRFEHTPHLYGLFSSKREASKVLADIARQHELCLHTLGLEKDRNGKACAAYSTQQCKGVCIGKEQASFHSARVMAALGRLKIQTWPFNGCATLTEENEHHLFNAWCYLGTARSDADLARLLEAPSPLFNRENYRLLLKLIDQLKPCGLQSLTAPR